MIKPIPGWKRVSRPDFYKDPRLNRYSNRIYIYIYTHTRAHNIICCHLATKIRNRSWRIWNGWAFSEWVVFSGRKEITKAGRKRNMLTSPSPVKKLWVYIPLIWLGSRKVWRHWRWMKKKTYERLICRKWRLGGDSMSYVELLREFNYFYRGNWQGHAICHDVECYREADGWRLHVYNNVNISQLSLEVRHSPCTEELVWKAKKDCWYLCRKCVGCFKFLSIYLEQQLFTP